MNWEQKLAALQAIAETCLRMREPGNWYVSVTGRAIGGDGMLTGAYGNGSTPEQAVEDDWHKIVEALPKDRYIVVNRSTNPRNLRWNGYMWQDGVTP